MAETAAKKENSIEEKLRALYNLQLIDSNIDRINTIRGELPLEVQDLEDELAGLQTRLEKMMMGVHELEKEISARKIKMTECNELIKKYAEQQQNVRNNREYDSLTKEIEFQTLEIELCEKKIKEHKAEIAAKQELIDSTKKHIEEREADLEAKKKELEDIVKETQKEEDSYLKERKKAASSVDDRLLKAYDRIRGNAINGLAVVNVERDACGGCFSKIPPQRQLDIKSHKKIIVCENCGRILIDFNERTEEVEEQPKKRRTTRRKTATKES
ncbi:MAG: zinc ribbon domain-containing protein [Luteibaculum sp.]